MPLATIASRASTDWKTEWIRTIVRPSRSSSVSVIERRHGPGRPRTRRSGRHAVRRRIPVEHAVEAVVVAVVVAVDVPPAAAVADVVSFDDHLVLRAARATGRAAPDRCSARKTRSRGASNSRVMSMNGTPGSARDLRGSHDRAPPSLASSAESGSVIRPGRPGAPRAARRVVRGSRPSTPGSAASHSVASRSGSASRWLSRAVARRVREIEPRPLEHLEVARDRRLRHRERRRQLRRPSGPRRSAGRGSPGGSGRRGPRRRRQVIGCIYNHHVMKRCWLFKRMRRRAVKPPRRGQRSCPRRRRPALLAALDGPLGPAQVARLDDVRSPSRSFQRVWTRPPRTRRRAAGRR